MSHQRIAPALIGTAGLALVLAACGGTSGSSTGSASTDATSTGEVTVVATTTILGDVVNQIATCAGATSTTLLPVGADPHDFAPSSAQVAELAGADVVVAIGLGLEEGLEGALESAAAEGATVIEVAEQVDPIEFGAGAHAEEEGHSEEEGHAEEEGHSEEDEHGHGDLDPHIWFDMERMAAAADIVGTELAATVGPQAAECGAQVAQEIRAAEVGVRETLESVPADRRVLITDHDALGYLADAYGFEIAGTVIPSGTTLAEPSSADLQALVELIGAEGVRAIFANSTEPTALADAVAAEAGSDVSVVTLYVDSLGEPGSGADTYIGLMQTNAQLIADALRD